MIARIAIGAAFLGFCGTAWPEAPTIDPADDEKYFGPPEAELFWTLEQKVSGYRNMDKIGWTRAVPAGGDVFPLPTELRDLGAIEINTGDVSMTVDDYVRTGNVAGLIVVKNGTVVYERYELGNTRESRWLSYSVAKSVTSLLVGAAIKDGYIKSVDERVTDYLPRLKNSAYDESSIRNLLQMASGVEWTEVYDDPQSDINRVTWPTLELYEYLRNKPRAAAPGEAYNYNTGETNLVGTLVRAAVGNNLSTYLSEKIWKPFGMEYAAYWVLSEEGGGEFGGSSLNATLRDYARIGLFALRNGRLSSGETVLPGGWMAESITPSAGNAEYGYLWWLNGDAGYSAAGIFGQGIYISPKKDLVIALHSAREHASRPEDWVLQNALYKAIDNALSN
jgi:CubicO group peptidase (beta-lactamase class C family)